MGLGFKVPGCGMQVLWDSSIRVEIVVARPLCVVAGIEAGA